MRSEPNEAYVYQPYPVTEGDKIYGVAGLAAYGYKGGPIRGLTKIEAQEIARFCNKNPEFAASFISGIRGLYDS